MELAQALGMTSAAYGQLENDDEEIESSVSLTQALQLARLLDTDLLSLLNESDNPPPLPVARVRAGLQAEINISPDIRESLEDEIDWDLGPFLEGLDAWGTVYTINFIKALSVAMSLDWRAVLGGIQGALLAVQCGERLPTGWTRSILMVTICRMPSGFQINKLSDEFGQYTLVMKCGECGHERKADPHALGRLCGWDAKLDEVAKRMRCSKCSKKRCQLRAFPPKKPRGYTSLPK